MEMHAITPGPQHRKHHMLPETATCDVLSPVAAARLHSPLDPRGTRHERSLLLQHQLNLWHFVHFMAHFASKSRSPADGATQSEPAQRCSTPYLLDSRLLLWNLRNCNLTNQNISVFATECARQVGCCLAVNKAKKDFTSREILQIAVKTPGKMYHDS